MTRVGFLFAFFLSAAFVSQSEGWRFWDRVKEAARQTADWVREHCSVHAGSREGVGVECSLNRRRRQLDPKTVAMLDELCAVIEDSSYALTGISGELVEALFEEVDGRTNAEAADGILNDVEYDTFMESMAAIQYCLSKSD